VDVIFLLCFLYACYRAALDAGVKGYALSKGRDVYVGEGASRRQYSGFSVGVVLGVFFRSLIEGVRVGWPWARRTAADWKERRKDGAGWTAPWDEMRPPRKRRRRDAPAGGPHAKKHPGNADAPDVPAADEADDGDYIDSFNDGDDEVPYSRCVRCGRSRDEDDYGPFRWMAEENGWVCWSHFDDHCAACGHRARPGDPLILTDGVWTHSSHQEQERPPTPPGAAVAVRAEMVDAEGRPVDAVWEPLQTERWASLHPRGRP
jgi:hypothetical protein